MLFERIAGTAGLPPMWSPSNFTTEDGREDRHARRGSLDFNVQGMYIVEGQSWGEDKRSELSLLDVLALNWNCSGGVRLVPCAGVSTYQVEKMVQ